MIIYKTKTSVFMSCNILDMSRVNNTLWIGYYKWIPLPFINAQNYGVYSFWAILLYVSVNCLEY